MFQVNDDLSIYVTRGDTVFLSVSAEENGVGHTFEAGDVLRIKVFGKKDAENVVLQKDFPVTAATSAVDIILTEEDTKIGDVISKPTDYWYEVELNPDGDVQTIIGYDEDGAKVFKLFPEGDDIPEYVPDSEVIKVIDDELDMTSERPVQNQAIARAFANLQAGYQATHEAVAEKFVTPEMYGAVGDGVADDAEAIQRAIDSGHPITLSPKTYHIGSSIYIKHSNIEFDASNATIEYSGADYAVILTNVHYKTVRFGDINAPNGGCIKLLSENGSNCVSYIDLYFSRLTANENYACIKGVAESENSYINEIRLYNGRLKKGKYGVECVNNTNHPSASRINNWKLYNVGLEGVETGIYLNAPTNRIERFLFVGLRYAVNEGTTCFLKTTGDCHFLTWVGSDKILFDTDYFKLSNTTARAYFFGNVFGSYDVGYMADYEYGEWFMNGRDSLSTSKYYDGSTDWDKIKNHGVAAFNTWRGEGGNNVFPTSAKGFLIVYDNEGDLTQFCVSPTALGSRSFSASEGTWGEWKLFKQTTIDELIEKANIIKVVSTAEKQTVTFNINAHSSIIYSTYGQSGIISVKSDLSEAPVTTVIHGDKPTINYNASAKTVTLTFPWYRTITFITKYTIAE